jgi:hypothetical protein
LLSSFFTLCGPVWSGIVVYYAAEWWYTMGRNIHDSNDLSNGKFLQINANGKFASAVQQFPQKRKKGSEVVIRTSFLTIELRNEHGTAMRIQGEMSAEQLREIMTIM